MLIFKSVYKIIFQDELVSLNIKQFENRPLEFIGLL